MNEKQLEESIKALKSDMSAIESSLNIKKIELDKLLKKQKEMTVTVSYYGTVFKANSEADAENSDHYVWVYSRFSTSKKPVLNHETPAMKHTSEKDKQTIPFSHSMLYGFAKVYEVCRGENKRYHFAVFSGNPLNIQSCFTDSQGAEMVMRQVKGTGYQQDLDPRSKLKENELFVKDLTENDIDAEYLYNGETVKLLALLSNGARFFKHDHSPDLCLDRMAILSFKPKEPEYILAEDLTEHDLGKYYKIVPGVESIAYDNKVVLFNTALKSDSNETVTRFGVYVDKNDIVLDDYLLLYKTTKLIPSTKEEFDAQFQ